MVQKGYTKINGKTIQESSIFISKNTTTKIIARNVINCIIIVAFDLMIRIAYSNNRRNFL